MLRSRLIGSALRGALPSLVGVVVITFMLTRALPGDPAAYFAGPAASAGGGRAGAHEAGLEPHAAGAVLASTSPELARGDLGQSLTTGQPVRERSARAPAGFARTDAVRAVAGAGASRCRWACSPPRARARGSTTPAGSSPRPACRCRSSSPGCCWSTSSTSCSAGRRRRSAGSIRFSSRAADHHRLLPDRQPAGGRLGSCSGAAPTPADAAGADAGHLRAGADRAHDARLDAGGAVGATSCAPRAPRACRAHHGAVALRVPQRAAAGGDDAGHGVLVPARRQRAGREGLRLARRRLATRSRR